MHHFRSVIAAVLGAAVAVAAATAGQASAGTAAAATAAGHASAAGRLDAQYCGRVPAADFELPPNQAHTGRYVNARYGYAVSIPAGLIGFSGGGGSQRGFGVVLSWTPRAYLRVDAAYDVFYDITADGVHRRDAGGVRLFDTLLSDHSMPAALAGFSGGRYLMRVRCAGDPAVYVHDDVIVVRRREIYRVQLQSTASRYAADVQLLDAMLSSWSWVPVRQ
jgi:hypothetical protein